MRTSRGISPVMIGREDELRRMAQLVKTAGPESRPRRLDLDHHGDSDGERREDEGGEE